MSVKVPSGDTKNIGLLEFLQLFVLPGEQTSDWKRTYPPLPIIPVEIGNNYDEFIVDETGVRAIIPGVDEMEQLVLSPFEKVALKEFERDCNLTWPVSMNDAMSWAERMGFEIADNQQTQVQPAIHTRIPARRGRHVTDGMNKAVAMFEERFSLGQRKNTLALMIAREVWPNENESIISSRANTILARTRNRKANPDETHNDFDSEQLMAIFLRAKPPSRT